MKKEQQIRILVVEPGKAPYAATIENTLEGMQSVVGGYIEYVPLTDDWTASLYCNDEGKINGLPPNRRLGNDIIAGTFFICGSDDGEYDCSLTDEQIAHYKGRFAAPEFVMPVFAVKSASSIEEFLDMLMDGKAGDSRACFEEDEFEL